MWMEGGGGVSGWVWAMRVGWGVAGWLADWVGGWPWRANGVCQGAVMGHGVY